MGDQLRETKIKPGHKKYSLHNLMVCVDYVNLSKALTQGRTNANFNLRIQANTR
ncbi:hypothetical protein PCC9214_00764 [Planktothrix tepida]|uniref:Uncharacterized protein n=2 Tax=Planktothrix TaxID=54304 RepID=A0A1J1LEQ9_9CYAN|nr:hypothetical protein PCC9214_00764 [Planktothrix tepida]CAD5982509.1 hypothetical protein NO713_05008 [Planktothrix pseudagardhii]CUR31059.1 hypothetical protein PL9214290650 [Planktothrix tepida PCC 9214]